jgi:hypothetical protein
MGLFRKTLSISSAGLIDFRDHSERAAAAERSKKNAYKARTKSDREMKERELAVREREIALAEREAELKRQK